MSSWRSPPNCRQRSRLATFALHQISREDPDFTDGADAVEAGLPELPSKSKKKTMSSAEQEAYDRDFQVRADAYNLMARLLMKLGRKATYSRYMMDTSITIQRMTKTASLSKG